MAVYSTNWYAAENEDAGDTKQLGHQPLERLFVS